MRSKAAMTAVVAMVLIGVSGRALAQLPNGAAAALEAKGRATTEIARANTSATAATIAVAVATNPATWWDNYIGPNPGCLTQEELDAKGHIDLASGYYGLAGDHLTAASGYIATANAKVELGDAYFALPNYTAATNAYNAATALASVDAFCEFVLVTYYLSAAAAELNIAKQILGVQ